MNGLLWLVGLTCAWWGLRYVLTVSMLVRARYGYINGSIADPADVPEHIGNLLTIPIERLQLLGFRDCGYLQVESSLRVHPLVRWVRLLSDADGCHFVSVSLRYPVNPRDPFSIDFYTWFNDGHLLLTLDRQAHATIDCFINTTVRDNRIHNLEGRWHYHQQQSELLSHQREISTRLDLTKFADNFFAHWREYIDYGIAKKVFLHTSEPSEFKLGFREAMRATDRLIRTAPKPQPLKESIVLPPQILNDNAKMLSGSHLRPFDRQTKLVLFGISIIAFYLIAIPTMGWEFGLQLLVIIFIHELGHLLAMQLFGYNNTSMLMIPLIGGVASGKKDDATLAQKFWVYILGPLPGIILGVTIAIYTKSNTSLTWLHVSALIAIGINLLNLLPIYPLDGGRIVNLLLRPYPYLGFVFKLICAVFSILFGLGQPLFLGIGIAIVMTLPTELRTAKAISTLKNCQAPAELDRDGWFEWVSTQIASNDSQNIKPAHQKLFLDNLWEWKSERHTAIWVRWGLTGIYLISLFGGAIGGLYGAFGDKLQQFTSMYADDLRMMDMSPTQRKQYYRAKWQNELTKLSADINKNPNNIQAYIRRLQIHGLLEDRQGMLTDLDRLTALLPNNISFYQQRIFIYQKTKEYSLALKDSDRILELSDNKIQKLYIYNLRSDLYISLKQPDRAIIEIGKALALDSNNLSGYLTRADLYLQIGQRDLAKKDLAKAIELKSENYTDYEARADLREKLGDKQGASEDRQTAKTIESQRQD
jgi:tetratricopeptide (TPR) repeat protein/Zn-dependent protease